MSEQSPERAALNEEPEVEGHRAGLTEDPSVLPKNEELDELEGPEVEGHLRALKPEDPSIKG
jgi:hypothetical protein